MNLLSNRIKFITLLLAVALVAGASVFVAMRSGHDHSQTATKEEQLYTCGMHPQVIQNKPGNCPICGMKLVPIRQRAGTSSTPANATPGSAERKIKFYKSTMNPVEIGQTPRKDSMGMEMVPVYEDEASDSSAISIDPVTVQNMGLRIGVVAQGPLRRVIRSLGVIDFDETALSDVTTKFRGWIEKLDVDATGKQVHRGEPLFEIYSPELFSAQTEFLLSLNSSAKASGPGAESLQASARNKLRFFDVSDEQIADLEKTRQPKKTLRVTASRDGVVMEKMAVEGQMVEAGMKLYRLADLALVWVQAQIYEQDLAYLKLGQESVVRLSYLPDREFRGRVTYIYPTVDEKTRTAKVRMEFHNPGFFLKPGMFATVEIQVELEPSALLVPDMAVLRSGEKNTVFVALEGGKFEPRTVALGPRAENNLYQVLSGLSEGERVVTSGQFLLDSESQLREAIQKMLKPQVQERAVLVASERESVRPSPTLHVSDAPRSMAYICPMPEHVAIKYNHPGKCAICGMALVPVSSAALAKLQPGGRVQFYTCPMPEHDDVKLEKPGKCAKCSMTLIPVMEAPPMPGPNTTSVKPAALYTCPMAVHADVVSVKPGKCPKCEMDLVLTSTVKHGKIAEENWRKQQTAPMKAGHQD